MTTARASVREHRMQRFCEGGIFEGQGETLQCKMLFYIAVFRHIPPKQCQTARLLKKNEKTSQAASRRHLVFYIQFL